MTVEVPGPYSDRCLAPTETWERIKPLLPSLGITRLSRLTDLDRIGIPVWNAVTPNSKSIVISQGKGLGDIDAMISAAMEAIERAVAGDIGISIIHATRSELVRHGETALALNELIAAGRDDLRDDDQASWIEAYDLMTKRRCYLPSEALILDRTVAEPRYWQSSDGLASGNTREEAVLHGVLERIERDAYTLWQLTPLAGRKRVDPIYFGDPALTALLDRIESAGFIVRLFEMTTDIGVPCYTALLAPADFKRQRELRFFEVSMGGGAHPNAIRAVIRAVTEAAQSRMTFISGARDDIPDSSFLDALPEETRACLDIERIVGPGVKPIVAGSVSDLLEWTLGRLAAAGVKSVLTAELSPLEFPVSVVKTVIPELENPEGRRKHRFGPRALAQVMELS